MYNMKQSVIILLIIGAVICAEGVKDERTTRVPVGDSATLTWPLAKGPRENIINIFGPSGERVMVYVHGAPSPDKGYIIPSEPNPNTIGFTINNVLLEHAGEYTTRTGNQQALGSRILFVYGPPEAPVLRRHGGKAVCTAKSTSQPAEFRPEMKYSFTGPESDVDESSTLFSRENEVTVDSYLRVSDVCCVSREEGSRLQSPRSNCLSLDLSNREDRGSTDANSTDTFPGTNDGRTHADVSAKKTVGLLSAQTNIILIIGGSIIIAGVAVIVLACLVMKASKKKGGYAVEEEEGKNESDEKPLEAADDEVFPDPPAALVRISMFPEIYPEALRNVNDEPDLPLPPMPENRLKGQTSV